FVPYDIGADTSFFRVIPYSRHSVGSYAIVQRLERSSTRRGFKERSWCLPLSVTDPEVPGRPFSLPFHYCWPWFSPGASTASMHKTRRTPILCGTWAAKRIRLSLHGANTSLKEWQGANSASLRGTTMVNWIVIDHWREPPCVLEPAMPTQNWPL